MYFFSSPSPPAPSSTLLEKVAENVLHAENHDQENAKSQKCNSDAQRILVITNSSKVLCKWLCMTVLSGLGSWFRYNYVLGVFHKKGAT